METALERNGTERVRPRTEIKNEEAHHESYDAHSRKECREQDLVRLAMKVLRGLGF